MGSITKDVLYSAFVEYCKKNALPVKAKNVIGRELPKHISVSSERAKIGDIRIAVWKGIWYLIKRLQHLLTHSFYAKLLAIRKVNQNRGKRTAGIDGETWSSPESKMKAALSLVYRITAPDT